MLLTILIAALACYQVSAEPLDVTYFENAVDSSSRILSGWEAYDGQFPHQVLLRAVNGAGSVGGCGGSVVHPHWVISAAHCTASRVTIVVLAGVTYIRTPEYIYETTEWYNHPTYNNAQPQVVQPNDITVIKMQRPMMYSNNLKAIRLQSTLDSYRSYDKEIVTASGFGRTWTNGENPERLNYVYLRAIANEACQLTFGATLINANAICAGFYNVTSQSTCQGDSGGPLTHLDSRGEPILIGVTSFVAGGNYGCHSGLPAGFIRTGPFHGWLRQVTGIDFENQEISTTLPPTSTLPPSTTIPLTPTIPPSTTLPPTSTLLPSTALPPSTTLPPNPTLLPSTALPPSTTLSPSTPAELPTTTGLPSSTGYPSTSTVPPTKPTTLLPTSPTTLPPPTSSTTEEPSEESEESNSTEESKECDPDLKELLKKLNVSVNVNININHLSKKKKHVQIKKQ